MWASRAPALRGRAEAAPGLGRAQSGLEKGRSPASPCAPSLCCARAALCRAGWVRWGTQEPCCGPFSPHLLCPLPLSIADPSPGTNGEHLRVTAVLHVPVLGAHFPASLPPPQLNHPWEDPSPSPPALAPTSTGRDPEARGGNRGPCGAWGAGGGAMLPPRPWLRRRRGQEAASEGAAPRGEEGPTSRKGGVGLRVAPAPAGALWGRLLALLPLCPEHLRLLISCCKALRGHQGSAGCAR